MEEFFGITRDEVIGQDKRKLVIGRFSNVLSNAGFFAEKMLKTYEDNSYADCFECHVLAGENRKERWLEYRSQPILSGLYAGGRIEHYYDITDRKWAEETLYESEGLLHTVIHSSREAIISIDERGLITLFNPAAEEMFAQRMEDMIGGTLDCLMPEEYREKHATYVRSYFASGKPDAAVGKVLELPGMRKDGYIFPMEISLSAGIRKGKKSVTAVARDITERKWAEEARRESEQKHRALVDNIDLCIVQMDSERRIIMANAVAEKRFGLKAEEMVGRRCYEVMHCSEKPCEGCPGAKAISSLQAEEVEIEKTDGNGEKTWLNVRAVPVIDGAGRASGYIEVLQDVTESKRTIEALYQAKQQAEAATLAKSQFLASMSHELRTPMNSILGFTERLIKRLGGSLPDRESDALETIDRNARQLLELINEILDLSKIEAGKMDLNLAPTNIAKIIRGIVTQFSPMLESKSLGIHIDLDADHMEIVADAVKIKQVIANLVSNAVKFTDKGKVTIQASFIADVRVGKGMLVSVSDTGVGISSDDYKNLFKKFVQVDGSASRRASGTGLGLAITAEYVAMHGGYIDVSSRLGKGSEFRVILPVSPEDVNRIEDLELAANTSEDE